jgi:hypothetical protein
MRIRSFAVIAAAWAVSACDSNPAGPSDVSSSPPASLAHPAVGERVAEYTTPSDSLAPPINSGDNGGMMGSGGRASGGEAGTGN